MNVDKMSFVELRSQLDEWIKEGGEITKVARQKRTRLTDEDDLSVLQVEVKNMYNYFKKEV